MKIETIEDVGKVIVNLPPDLKEYLIKNVTPATFVSCLILLRAGGKVKDFTSAVREQKELSISTTYENYTHKSQ